MNPEVAITCAVTGAGDTVGKHPDVPVTPAQIAASALDAAKAGAAIVHCHVRDPATGKGSRDVALYREVVDRIRDADTDVVINLTAGMGGDLFIGPEDNLYLKRGVYATNAQLVERARQIVELLGARVLGPDEARSKFGLVRR